MTPVDGERVRSAIDRAEHGTTARIAVHVSGRKVADAVEHARHQFARAKLHEHPHANAVLFVVAPKSRTFAVYGGSAVHERLGDAFWEDVVAKMKPFFAQDRATDALVEGIGMVGARLHEAFPKEAAR